MGLRLHGITMTIGVCGVLLLDILCWGSMTIGVHEIPLTWGGRGFITHGSDSQPQQWSIMDNYHLISLVFPWLNYLQESGQEYQLTATFTSIKSSYDTRRSTKIHHLPQMPHAPKMSPYCSILYFWLGHFIRNKTHTHAFWFVKFWPF